MNGYNNILCARMKHSKPTIVAYCIVAFLMWIIGGWNTDNGDFSNYEGMYDNDILAMTLSTTPDYGFFLVLDLFKSMGLSLVQARIVIYFIFITTLSIAILKYCRRPVLALFLYFLVFYFRDVITLRNTVAMIFLLIGILFLISDTCKYRKIKYAICILVASTIHISFLFYFILLFIDLRINVKLYALAAIVLSFLGKPILGVLSSHLISEENGQAQAKVDGLIASGSYFSLIICGITIFLSVYICKLAYKYLRGKKDVLPSNAIYKINLIMICLIIMTSVSMTFIRVFYNVLLFDMIVMINVISYKKRLDFIPMCWFLWVYIWAFWMSNVSNNFVRILSNNLLLSSL